MNKQREVIYAERRKILGMENLKPVLLDMIQKHIGGLVQGYLASDFFDITDVQSLVGAVRGIFPLPPEIDPEELAQLKRGAIEERLRQLAMEAYEAKEAQLGSEMMRQLERLVMLHVIDRLWVEHLTAIDDLRDGIGLRAYGQRDPLVEYKSEAYSMFQGLLENIEHDIVHTIYRVTVHREPPRQQRAIATNREEGGRTPTRVARKVGRNDPCPCGSGKKYKKCCGR